MESKKPISLASATVPSWELHPEVLMPDGHRCCGSARAAVIRILIKMIL